MKADIKLTITRLTPAQVNGLLGLVASSMENNPAFPDPAVPIADMRALHTRLTHAISEATDGSRLSKCERNKIVAEAMDMLRTQASYVRSKANGSAVILTASGFELQQERKRIGVPEPPHVTLAKTDQPGTLKLRWNRARGAKAYKVFLRLPGSTITELLSVTTSASHIITGLESFQQYGVQVSAIGAAGYCLMRQMM
jgi:hypothetical protein